MATHCHTVQTTHTSRLLQLPIEILETIVHWTAYHSQNTDHPFMEWRYPEYNCTDLKSMAFTCTQLFTLCVPYLWKDTKYISTQTKKSAATHPSMIPSPLLSEPPSRIPQSMGRFVRSLHMDLTTDAAIDVDQHHAMAQHVHPLQALRIDFHPRARSSPYGLHSFAQHCPRLSELYIEHCKDAYDDFYSFVQSPCPLQSITLHRCTVKQSTLHSLLKHSQHSLTRLHLQGVLIEPDTFHLFLGPISSSFYCDVFPFLHLTRLVLSDAVSSSVLESIVHASPSLETLAVALHETHPVQVSRCLFLLTRLGRLDTLSLAFRRAQSLNTVHERLPCCAPASEWTHFSACLPRLRLVHISASQILLHTDFFDALLPLLDPSAPFCLLLHSVAWVGGSSVSPLKQQEEGALVYDYERDRAQAQDTLEVWQQQVSLWEGVGGFLMSSRQALLHGYTCVSPSDGVCCIKGYVHWENTCI